METFERALAEDPERDSGSAEHISAYTDFIPIRQKVLKRDERKKKRKQQQIEASADGFMYHLLRYPLMVRHLLFGNGNVEQKNSNHHVDNLNSIFFFDHSHD